MRTDSLKQKIDWVLIGLYLVLSIIGVIFIYSTDITYADKSIFNIANSSGKQFIFLLTSIVIGVFIIVVDYKFYTGFSYVLFGLVLLSLLAVLFLGVEVNGSKSWFSVGSFRFQPAELAKFGTCLALAKLISSYNFSLRNTNGILKAFGLIALPVFFILLQKDVGSALVFSSLIFVLHREGLNSAFLIISFSLIISSLLALLFPSINIIYFYSSLFLIPIFYNKKAKHPFINIFLIALACALYAYIYNYFIVPNINALQSKNALLNYLFFLGPILILILIGYARNYKSKKWLQSFLLLFLLVSSFTLSVGFMFNNVLKPHHRDRINLILGKIDDYSGAGYNLFQSKVAIGSGGILGKGYLKGAQTMLNYVPAQSTDFIFTSIAEQFGFVGSLFLITLFVTFLLRIVQIAERQRSTFARVYGYGVASILFTHFAINIAMTIGLAPVIGIPLPFISYGGSSLLSFTILLFVLIKFDTERLSVLH